jgi:biotin transporter BioY
MGAKKAFLLGVVPFILPDVLKNMLMIQILKSYNWANKA